MLLIFFSPVQTGLGGIRKGSIYVCAIEGNVNN
jgi:hypothetical protein